MRHPVIAIVGLSNSGKTRVATALVKLLVESGYRIAAVKHSPHGHQVDRAGTDSALLFEAGAARVVISSPGRMTTLERTPGDAALEEIVTSLDPSYDLVVAEGFKGSGVAKVLVLGGEEPSPRPQNVIAVVSETRRLEEVPCYSFQDLAELANLIRDQVLHIEPSIFSRLRLSNSSLMAGQVIWQRPPSQTPPRCKEPSLSLKMYFSSYVGASG